jgi:hypothetical protein
MLFFYVIYFILLLPILSQPFKKYGSKGQRLAELGGIENLEQAVQLFQKQRKSARSKREAFTAINNVAVTMLRIGNLKHPATNSINAYKIALKSWRKCLKLNKKSKKVKKNLKLLEETCRRRFHGAPDCDEALKEDSTYQQSPKFLRSMYKGSITINARTGNSRTSSVDGSEFHDIFSTTVDETFDSVVEDLEDLNIVYETMSSLITEGIKNIRLYKKEIQKAHGLNNEADKYGEKDLISNERRGANRESVELSNALLQFTKASGLYSSLIMKSTSNVEFGDENDANQLDSIVASNNIAAIYLMMATNELSGTDLNREIIYTAQRYIDEAERILKTNPYVLSLHEEQLSSSSMNTKAGTNRCMKAVSINFAIIDRMKRQAQRELDQLRGDVPFYLHLSEKPSKIFRKRKPHFEPIERIQWPPSSAHLLNYGFKSLPTIGAYLRRRNTPCVIENTKDYVDTWKLQKKWSNTSYLKKHLNPILFVSMTESSSNLYGTDKMDSRMNTAEFFQRLHQMNSTNGVPHDGKHPYISIDINHDNIQENGILEDDLSNTNFHDVSAGYMPIGNPMKLILWVGASNVSAVGHYDHAFNCFMMIRGSKRFIVAPPGNSIDLYFHPAPSMSHRQSQMRNYDKINSNVYPRAIKVPFQEAEVMAGEIMYLPPLWIHSVESTSGPSVAISAWSYPGQIIGCINELSNNFRTSTQRVLDSIIYLTKSVNMRIKIHRATYFTFILRVLVKVFDEGVQSSRVVIGDGSSYDFVRALLESKYNNEHSIEAGCGVKATCPNKNDLLLIPSVLDRAIEKESIRRAKMLGAEGFEVSPLGSMLEVGAHVPLMMASIEFLSHVGLSFGKTINHGDEAGTKVCDFIHSCLLPMLETKRKNKK